MMRINFPYIQLILLIIINAIFLTCSGSQLVSTGPEAVCGRDRIDSSDSSEKFQAGNTKWRGGDGWKAISEIKEQIDDEEEKGPVDPELYFRRSDWGMRVGAKATARRDVQKILKQGKRDLGLLASARFNAFYSKYDEALKDVTERRALLCADKGPECVAGCDLQRGFLLGRLGRKQEATAIFQQCKLEHKKASASCGKFGNALTEYFLGEYDAAGQTLSGVDSDWQGTAEYRVLGLLIENKGRASRSQVRSMGLKGFNTSNALEEMLVFPFYP